MAIPKVIRQVLGWSLIGLVLVFGGTAPALGWSVTQITNNNFVDRSPVISGRHVAWDGYPPWTGIPRDYEIYYWDGTTITQITNNDLIDDEYPHISGSNVVWMCRGDDDVTQICFWDGTFPVGIIQITNTTPPSGGSNQHPVISGSNVVYMCGLGADTEICLARPGLSAPALSTLSTSAVTLLAGLLMGTTVWLIRRQRVASA